MNYVCYEAKQKTKQKKNERKENKKNRSVATTTIAWDTKFDRRQTCHWYLAPKITKQNQDECSDRLPYAFVLPYSFTRPNTDEMMINVCELVSQQNILTQPEPMEYGCVARNEKRYRENAQFSAIGDYYVPELEYHMCTALCLLPCTQVRGITLLHIHNMYKNWYGLLIPIFNGNNTELLLGYIVLINQMVDCVMLCCISSGGYACFDNV